MANLSTYFQEKILNTIRGTAFGTAPAAVYVALFSADPTDAGLTTNEVTTTVRAAGRVAATFGAPSTAAGTSTIANSAIVDFGSSSGSTTVTHFGVFDAQSAGNMIGYGTISNGAIATGNNVTFAIGDLSISLS